MHFISVKMLYTEWYFSLAYKSIYLKSKVLTVHPQDTWLQSEIFVEWLCLYDFLSEMGISPLLCYTMI